MQKPKAAYDREFAEIRANILRIGEMVSQAIADAVASLEKRDAALARQVIEGDAGINALRFKVEEACLALIATQQPAARDLRCVLAAMIIVVEIERMGDHASGIAKTVIRMGDEPLLKPLVDIPRMAQMAREMLHDCLRAFLDYDTDKASRVADRDEEMDHLYHAVFDELLGIMACEPSSVQRATYLLWCAHNLERIGDRVTNIAERVIFMTTGLMKELNV
jgi:phosphate transport system protein